MDNLLWNDVCLPVGIGHWEDEGDDDHYPLHGGYCVVVQSSAVRRIGIAIFYGRREPMRMLGAVRCRTFANNFSEYIFDCESPLDFCDCFSFLFLFGTADEKKSVPSCLTLKSVDCRLTAHI